MRFIVQNYGFVYLVGSGSIPLPLLIVRKTVQVWSRAPPYVPDLARRAQPSRPAPVCSFSILRPNLVLTYEIPPERRGGVHFFIERDLFVPYSGKDIGGLDIFLLATLCSY